MNESFNRYWNLLARHIRAQKGRFALLGLLLLAGTALQLANPQIVRAFIDGASAGEDAGRLATLALAFIGLALLQQAAGVGARCVGDNVGWTATNTLRGELLHHCLHLDMGFHGETSPGELIERIDGDSQALSGFFSTFVLLVVGNLLLLLGVLVMLFLEDARVGLLFTGFALVALWGLKWADGRAGPYWQEGREASAGLYGFVEERLAGLDDVRANGAAAYVMGRFRRAQREFVRRSIRARLAGASVATVVGALLKLGSLGGLAMGIYLFQHGSISLGTVYLIVHYNSLILRPLHALRRQVDSLQQYGASVERVEQLLGTQAAVQDGPGVALSPGSLEVSFDSVSFDYGGGEPVLRDVSFQLEPGRALGLLGRTGSGKTTMARLLFRLYDPTAGAVWLGGHPLPRLEVADLRRRVGLVTQEVQLLNGTLRDNVTLFDPAVPDERILEVVRALGLQAWYERMPDGLDTLLGGGGEGLSAGEAQLLAFARVFLEDPGLVILDEASSRLDPATERAVDRAVARLLAGRTAVVIAHRLATVQRADDILILEEGRIREYGAREALAGDPDSRFAGLLAVGLQEVLA